MSAARRAVPPSNMSLLGLVRHLATVEQAWFRVAMAGEDVPRLYRGEGEDEFGGAVADPAVVEDAYTRWREEIGFAEGYVDRTDDLLRERIDGRVGQ